MLLAWMLLLRVVMICYRRSIDRGRHKVLSLPMLHVWAWRAVTTLYVDAKWYRYDCMGRMRS